MPTIDVFPPIEVNNDPFSRDRDLLVAANYAKEGVTATTYYMLIDLSSAAYPHDNTGTRLVLAGAAVAALKSQSSARWAVQLGVVLEIDAVDSKIGWLPVVSAFLRDTSKFEVDRIVSLFPNLLDLAQSTGAYAKIATSLAESGIAQVNTGIVLEDALGGSVAPALGDLVLRAEKIDGAGTLGFSVGVQYCAA